MALGIGASAQISYTYDWEPTGLGSWTTSGSGSFSRNTTTPCNGTASVRANNYYNSSSYLVSPVLTGTNGGDLTVGFSYKVTQYSSNTTGASAADFGVINLQWSTSASGPWTTAYTISSSAHVVSATCAAKTATITGLPSSGNVYLRFEAKSGLSTSDNYVYFDDITVSQGAAPSCLPTSAPTVSNIGLNTADIAWTAPSSAPASGYEYYLSTSNTAPTASTAATGTSATTSKSLSSLSSNTTYYVWVRSVCSASDKSSWSTSGTFTTLCSSTGIPYTLDFNSVTTPSLPNCTAVVNDGTGNVWTSYNLNSSGFTGNVLNYTYNTTNAANTWFFTQGINLTAGTSYRIKYKYGNASGTTYPEKLKVAYGTSPLSSSMNNTLADYPNVSNSTANSTFVDFTPSTTGVYYFGFQAYSAADMNRLYVDDINIDVTPTCSEPTALASSNVTTASADIAWTAPATAPANGYEIYYSTTNTAPTAVTTPTITGVTGTSRTLSSLTQSTTYYVWVRSACSSSDKSIWSSSLSFTTLTPPPANDNCSSPMALTPGGTFAQNPVIGTTAGATLTTDATATTTCQTTRYADTWYSVVVPASGNITIETQSVSGSNVTDTVLGVYSGSCGALTQIGCDDDSSTDGNFSLVSLTGLTPGSTLMIGVWNYSSSTVGQFKVSAYDASLVLATNEVKDAKNNVKVYPNPFSEVLNISDASNVKNVLVTDISGRLVKTIANPSSELHLGELKQGMYLVTLEMKDGSKQTIKTIKK